MDPSAADRLIEKLRAFAADLDEEERGLLGALIAPGIRLAYPAEDVAGFDMVAWAEDALPASLAEAVRTSGVQVVGLTETE